MIKVFASDMDGTLLGDDHNFTPETIKTIKKATDAGYRFIICTGRDYHGALRVIKDTGILCDYILGSGSEVRNSDEEVLVRHPMDYDLCERIYDTIKQYPVFYMFMTGGYNYQFGTEEEALNGLALHLRRFLCDLPLEELKKTPDFARFRKNYKVVKDLAEMKARNLTVFKIFLDTDDMEILHEINEKLKDIPDIAAASSFSNNIEITHVSAQKGPVLKEYIESLGYAMDEVMVFGDSMNDYSMMSMDFATVAVSNAMPEILKVSKYTTRSNTENGVAYAMEEVMKRQGSIR